MLSRAMSCCFHQPAPALTCFRITTIGVRCFGRRSGALGKPLVVVPAAQTPALADPKSVPQKRSGRNRKKMICPGVFLMENAGAKMKTQASPQQKQRNRALTGAHRDHE